MKSIWLKTCFLKQNVMIHKYGLKKCGFPYTSGPKHGQPFYVDSTKSQVNIDVQFVSEHQNNYQLSLKKTPSLGVKITQNYLQLFLIMLFYFPCGYSLAQGSRIIHFKKRPADYTVRKTERHDLPIHIGMRRPLPLHAVSFTSAGGLVHSQSYDGYSAM